MVSAGKAGSYKVASLTWTAVGVGGAGTSWASQYGSLVLLNVVFPCGLGFSHPGS